MKIKANKAHMEIIFPVVLFLIFTLTALFIILYAARTYQGIVESSDDQYEETTSLAYLCRKVEAGDTDGNISVTDFNHSPALSIAQTIEGVSYVTLIYAYDGNLREIFTELSRKSDISPEAGTILFTVDEFTPALKGNLLDLTISRGGKSFTRFVTIRGEAAIG